MRAKFRSSKVHLPRRVGSSASLMTLDEVENRAMLVKSITERVESLPGIRRRTETLAGEPARHSYHIDNDFLRDPSATDSSLFAVVHLDGRIYLARMPRPELEEVVRAGWGAIRSGRLVTFAPRDVGDLTILWRIILMSYFDIAERRTASAWESNLQQLRNSRSSEIVGPRKIALGAFF